MSISSHLGIVILVIVGMVTVLGVIIIAIIEARRMDREKPSVPQQTAVKPSGQKKRLASART